MENNIVRHAYLCIIMIIWLIFIILLGIAFLMVICMIEKIMNYWIVTMVNLSIIIILL